MSIEAPTVSGGVIEAADLRAYLVRAAGAIERHARLLDRLDAALGDGDHGENMMAGCSEVLQAVAEEPTDDLGAICRQVGHTLVASVGGASGPLYGTAWIEAGIVLDGARSIGLAEVAAAFEAGVAALARRGRCGIGDKTVYDALAPAARVLAASASAGAPLEMALTQAAWAARAGMLATTPLVARRGLALRLGERSRGHQDPGATSSFLLVRALLP